MPFDPDKPAQGSPNSSAEMRAQLNALNDKIDGIPAGPAGPQGEPGPQGPPGEVTQAALDAAIAGTARNPNTLSPLNITISDPPTQAEVQAILDAHNTLLSILIQ